jgi:hypothetical protein
VYTDFSFVPGNVTIDGSNVPCKDNFTPGGPGSFTCTLTSLAKGASTTIIAGVTANADAGAVSVTGTVSSDTVESNPNNNSVTANVLVKAPPGGACKAGVCDTGATATAAPCATFASVTSPVGYYITNAAIWNTYTVKSCSSGPQTVNVQVQELNTLTGGIDFNYTSSMVLGPAQNLGSVVDNDFAAYSTHYTITYTISDSSGNVLDTATSVADTPAAP